VGEILHFNLIYFNFNLSHSWLSVDTKPLQFYNNFKLYTDLPSLSPFLVTWDVNAVFVRQCWIESIQWSILLGSRFSVKEVMQLFYAWRSSVTTTLHETSPISRQLFKIMVPTF